MQGGPAAYVRHSTYEAVALRKVARLRGELSF
jgi:hypothetical protein